MVWSVRIYRLLLRVYPRAFRREFGPLMVQAFRDLARDATRSGGAKGLVRLWWRTVPDLLAGAAVVYTRDRAVSSSRTGRWRIRPRLDTVGRHVRYAGRSLARTPGFAAALVLTIGLGVGASSTVFSAVDAVLLRPLPYPAADRLVRLRQSHPSSAETSVAPVRLEDWHRLNSTFDAITGYFVEDVTDTSGPVPQLVRRAFVAPRFAEVWAVAPLLGRTLVATDHRRGAPGAALLSHRYWRTRFGGRPGALDEVVRLGAASIPVVGVMPATFRFPDRDVDIWMPMTLTEQLEQMRTATWLIGIGRLGPGVTVNQARADLMSVQATLGDRFGGIDREIGVAVSPLKADTVGEVGATLWLLFGAVTILLCITCANTAALVLVHATRRTPQMALRRALGATRAMLAGQILAETALLALGGGGLGLGLAALAWRGLPLAMPTMPRIDEVTVDWRVALYTLLLSVGVAAACGLLPALRASGRSSAGSLSGPGRGALSTAGRPPWLLVAAQVTLSVTLLTATGLLARSAYELSTVRPGFDPSNVLTFRVSGSWNETADYPRLTQRIDLTIAHLRALPGVLSAATTIFPPGVPMDYEMTFALSEARHDADTRMAAESRFVSPEYFETIRIPLVRGRPCARTPAGPAEVMVNRAFVDRYLSDRPSAVGLHLVPEGPAAAPQQVVGVVADVRERGLDRDPAPVVYTCLSAPNPMPYFLVRTDGDAASLAPSLRLALRDLEPTRAVYDVGTIDGRLGAAYSGHRARLTVLALFAAAALTLAAVGLYGALSYVVGQRRREIGLRLALGSARTGVVGHFAWRGLRVAGAACAAGLLISVGLARPLSTLLFGVSVYDPLTLAAVAAVTLSVAAAAAAIPAARAAFADPVAMMRQD